MQSMLSGPKIRRLYYSINEVSKITQIHSSILKRWENKFPDLKISKSKSGRRLYKPSDLDTILRIKGLKEEGHSEERIYFIIENKINFKDKNKSETIGNREKLDVSLRDEIIHGLKEILDLLDMDNKHY
jgi:DNA-binding transcriptional MerR regulator